MASTIYRIILVRAMFEHFAKIGRAAGASSIWQNFKTLNTGTISP